MTRIGTVNVGSNIQDLYFPIIYPNYTHVSDFDMIYIFIWFI